MLTVVPYIFVRHKPHTLDKDSHLIDYDKFFALKCILYTYGVLPYLPLLVAVLISYHSVHTVNGCTNRICNVLLPYLLPLCRHTVCTNSERIRYSLR